MPWWRGLQLRTRLYIILGFLLLIIISTGVSQFIYTYHIQSFTTALYDNSIRMMLSAQELVSALASQKGFVSYYYLDKNPEWLDLLAANRRVFDSLIVGMEQLDSLPATEPILHQIKDEYLRYDSVRTIVIAQYHEGNFDTGQKIHEQMRSHFQTILNLTLNYKQRHDQILTGKISALQTQARGVRAATTGAIAIAVLLGTIFVFLLRIEILKPIKSLAKELGNGRNRSEPVNEVTELGHQIHGLLEDVDKSQNELQRSQTKLAESEKMAVVGKLAAELAHGIRSPMTSIEMRLYSLEQNIELDEPQKEDIRAIYNDLSYLDTVIGNFLEFSRPPRLRKQKIDIELPIERALLLLEQKLKRHGIEVIFTPPSHQLFCFADPERIKEVFVNLLVNACDAIGTSGHVSIDVSAIDTPTEDTGIRITIKDSGPGLPDEVKEFLWDPFVTTKENGTGLGLSIAKRIILEHDGTIMAQTDKTPGAMFIIELPQSQ